MSEYTKGVFAERPSTFGRTIRRIKRKLFSSKKGQEERPKVHITSKGARYVTIEEIARNPAVHEEIERVAKMTFGAKGGKVGR